MPRRTSHRAAACRAALLATLLAGAAAPAFAGDPSPAATRLAAWLDADAPVLLAVRPEPAAAIAAALLGDDPAGGALAMLRGALGFDPATAAGWREAGLDPAIVWASAGAIDAGAAADAADLLGAAAVWNDVSLRKVRKVYWRGRLVARVVDRRRADRWLEALAARHEALLSIAKDDDGAIAMLLGARATKGPRILPELRRHRIAVVGWLPGLDALVFFHRAGNDVLVCDVLASFAGVPVIWPRDGGKILKLVDRTGGGPGADVARRLAAPALALQVQPGPLAAAVYASGLSSSLRAPAASRPRGSRSARVERCVPAPSPLGPLTLTLDGGGDHVGVQAVWPIAPELVAPPLAAMVMPPGDPVALLRVTSPAAAPPPLPMTACARGSQLTTTLFSWPWVAVPLLAAAVAGAPPGAHVEPRTATLLLARSADGKARHAALFGYAPDDAPAARRTQVEALGAGQTAGAATCWSSPDEERCLLSATDGSATLAIGGGAGWIPWLTAAAASPPARFLVADLDVAAAAALSGAPPTLAQLLALLPARVTRLRAEGSWRRDAVLLDLTLALQPR